MKITKEIKTVTEEKEVKAGDKMTMYYNAFGLTSEETVTVKDITDSEITIDQYYDSDDGEIYYRFDIVTGKCINGGKGFFGYGSERKLKIY
jgi:hypothetical protein